MDIDRSTTEDQERWITQAEADLTAAQVNLNAGQYYVVALLAQQAAEKALKAVVIHQTNQLPPKIHDLVRLGKLVQTPPVLDEALELLEPTYLSSRYPDATEAIPVDEYSKTDAHELLEAAGEVYQWSTQQM